MNDFGIYTSLYWSLTTDMGLPTDMVYSYTDVATISYGCLSDGCYNFYLYDYGWTPELEVPMSPSMEQPPATA